MRQLHGLDTYTESSDANGDSAVLWGRQGIECRPDGALGFDGTLPLDVDFLGSRHDIGCGVVIALEMVVDGWCRQSQPGTGHQIFGDEAAFPRPKHRC